MKIYSNYDRVLILASIFCFFIVCWIVFILINGYPILTLIKVIAINAIVTLLLLIFGAYKNRTKIYSVHFDEKTNSLCLHYPIRLKNEENKIIIQPEIAKIDIEKCRLIGFDEVQNFIEQFDSWARGCKLVTIKFGGVTIGPDFMSKNDMVRILNAVKFLEMNRARQTVK